MNTGLMLPFHARPRDSPIIFGCRNNFARRPIVSDRKMELEVPKSIILRCIESHGFDLLGFQRKYFEDGSLVASGRRRCFLITQRVRHLYPYKPNIFSWWVWELRAEIIALAMRLDPLEITETFRVEVGRKLSSNEEGEIENLSSTQCHADQTIREIRNDERPHSWKII